MRVWSRKDLQTAHLAGQVTSRGAVTCGRGGLRCVRALPGSSASSAVMELKHVVGQCAPLFFLAVAFDLVGFLVLLGVLLQREDFTVKPDESGCKRRAYVGLVTLTHEELLS
ncbi:transmembrane protein [Clarias magur]|uniref:Transmembrane protein n=1 Tax=Clarias magur TaxID=1594786 RepID=A0A8J4TTE3_CLAMG|nr:transmembrane protein [Clarias magur]